MNSLLIDGKKEELTTYNGLPLDTHSSLKYCPSCGTIKECTIFTWGASVVKKERSVGKQEHKSAQLGKHRAECTP